MRTASANLLAPIGLPSRYDLLFPLAAGGTAAVHLGRLRGIAGFWRLVAVKVAHAHLNEDPLCREMLVEEARLASKIHHPNVVPVIDIDDVDGRLLLVMDYVEGASLSEVIDSGAARVPARIAVRIALDACAGLHAAHELTDASGRNLGLVHRDVSPQNILLGTDGVARLTDFGIAKTAFGKGRSGVGALKGKLGYMAPEYIGGTPANAGSDVFGLAVVVWEMLAGRRLFRGDSGPDTLHNVLYFEAPLASEVAPLLGKELDAVLSTALAKMPEARFPSAKAFGAALAAAARRANLIATSEEVCAFVNERVGEKVALRRRRIAEMCGGGDVPPRPRMELVPASRDEITSQEVPRPADIRPANRESSISGERVIVPHQRPLPGPDDVTDRDAAAPVMLPPPPEAVSNPSEPPSLIPPSKREEITSREVPRPRLSNKRPPPSVDVLDEPSIDTDAIPGESPEEPGRTAESAAERAPSPSSRPSRPSPSSRPAPSSRSRGLHMIAIPALILGALARLLTSGGDAPSSEAPTSVATTVIATASVH